MVEIDARTNVAYRTGLVVTFTVGSFGETEGSAPTTATLAPWGEDGFAGSLAVVPGSRDDAPLSIRLVLGVDQDARTCTAPDYRGCIVSRRRLRYSPHARLRLPMTLYAECKNVPCDADNTCNILGQCVPSVVDPATCDSAEGCTVHGDPQPVAPPPIADASTEDSPATSDGSMTEGGADAADAANDTATDAHRDGAATPGLIDCRSSTCMTGSYECCFDSTTLTGQCTPSNNVCSNASDATLKCDGPEDCAAGEKCCAMGKFAVCVSAVSCMAYEGLCHSDADCPTGKCVGTYLSYYSTCR